MERVHCAKTLSDIQRSMSENNSHQMLFELNLDLAEIETVCLVVSSFSFDFDDLVSSSVRISFDRGI